MAPGPDNVFVLLQSALYGRRVGLLIVAGLCAGVTVQTFCAAAGLSAILATSPAMLGAIKVAGACYLAYLSAQCLRHAFDGVDEGGGRERCRHPVARGFMMNITNPKVQLFFLAFFPQFMPEGRTGIERACDALLLGMIFTAVTALTFSAVALCADRLSERLRRGKAMTALNICSGAVFGILAVYTLFF